MIAKIEADTWRDLAGHLKKLSHEALEGMSRSSVSGGYSAGHIIVTSEDGTIDHDSWAAELDRYLDQLNADAGPASP